VSDEQEFAILAASLRDRIRKTLFMLGVSGAPEPGGLALACCGAVLLALTNTMSIVITSPS